MGICMYSRMQKKNIEHLFTDKTCEMYLRIIYSKIESNYNNILIQIALIYG